MNIRELFDFSFFIFKMFIYFIEYRGGLKKKKECNIFGKKVIKNIYSMNGF